MRFKRLLKGVLLVASFLSQAKEPLEKLLDQVWPDEPKQDELPKETIDKLKEQVKE